MMKFHLKVNSIIGGAPGEPGSDYGAVPGGDVGYGEGNRIGGGGGGGTGFFSEMGLNLNFTQPPASAYENVLGSVSDSYGSFGNSNMYSGDGRNFPPQMQPQFSPLQMMAQQQAQQQAQQTQQAQQQAQMDMNGGGWGGPYQSPQMNPMQTYDSSGWQPPFQFGQFFGGK
jgi:hypothetical protein